MFAFIIPLGGGSPDQGLPGVPPGVNIPTFPTHPIAPGGPPLGIWGGGASPMPTPPIAIAPPPQVGIPVFPTPPIAEGGGGDGGHVSPPIAGGFILVFHPAYGWVLIGGEKPEQPPTAAPKK